MRVVSIICVAAAGCWRSSPPPAAPISPAPAPALALDDGTVCPPGPRGVVDACLAEHAFCARDVTPLEPALPDLVVVLTHGAIDCAGYYLLAAAGGRWAPIVEVHRYTHHDPRFGSLAMTGAHDEMVKGHRVTRLAFTIELVPDDSAIEAPPPEHHDLSCTWPATGFPTCQ